MNKFLPIIMSGILALPTMAFAASSVRTLGGAGTYNGVTSVGSGTAARAGSIRAVPAVKVSKPSVTTSASTSGSTGTVSGATAGTGTRMSIGKYLSGSGIVSSNISASTTAAGINDVQNLVDELGKRIDELETLDEETAADIKSLWDALDATVDELEEDYVTKEFLDSLKYINEAKLNAALELYAKTADVPTSQQIADTIADSITKEITDPQTGVLKNYATTSELSGYLKSDDFGDKFNDAFNTASGGINTALDKIREDIDSIPSFTIYDGKFNPEQLDTGN